MFLYQFNLLLFFILFQSLFLINEEFFILISFFSFFFFIKIYFQKNINKFFFNYKEKVNISFKIKFLDINFFFLKLNSLLFIYYFLLNFWINNFKKNLFYFLKLWSNKLKIKIWFKVLNDLRLILDFILKNEIWEKNKFYYKMLFLIKKKILLKNRKKSIIKNFSSKVISKIS
uniref:hypothetical protein n=1 Tax=Neorhodella cyanea TaxID=131155 RepID=UPI001FCDA76A|nr:hypothetical protein MW616_mgp05 [Neorhodella cyanea]UNJ18809.1 hypothetical protein [Neorhodella cyanea]